MIVSHQPLSDQFIAEVLDRPVRNVTRALNQLGSLVPVQQGTRSPFHKSLFDWLRASQETPHTYALPVGGGLDLFEKWCERVETAEANIFLARLCENQACDNQDFYDKEEKCYGRALAITEKALGKDHPDVAKILDELAELLGLFKGDMHEAIPLLERALAIREKALGKDHPSVANSLNHLAEFYGFQGEDEKAEMMFLRALAIEEKILGEEHPNVATSLNNLAMLYSAQSDYPKALPLYERSLAILENALGKDHPYIATSLNNYADCLEALGKTKEAAAARARAKKIKDQIDRKSSN